MTREELTPILTSSLELRTSNLKEKGSARAPIQISQKRVRNLSKQPFFLQLLTINAVRCPGNGLQAFFADRIAAVRADREGVFFDAVERLVDEHEQVALAVRKGEVELLRIGARGFVGEILDSVIRQRVAGRLVPLE